MTENDDVIIEQIFNMLVDCSCHYTESQILDSTTHLYKYIVAKQSGNIIQVQSGILQAIDCLHHMLGASAWDLGNVGFLVIFDMIINLAKDQSTLLFARLRLFDILLSFRANSSYQIDFLQYGSTGVYSSALPPAGLYSVDTQGGVLVPMGKFIEIVIDVLTVEKSWTLFWHLLRSFPIQSENVYVFRGVILEIQTLLSKLFDLVNSESVASNFLDIPSTFKKTDIYDGIYSILINFLVYKQFFSKKQQDELVYLFQIGLQKWPRGTTAKICIQASTLALFEVPDSITRLLPSILLKVAQTTSSNIGVWNVEFLSTLGRLPLLYKNFTEAEFKRIFGVALQYIQYTDVSFTNNKGQAAVNQYIVNIAYVVLSGWFKNLKYADRKKYVPFIIQFVKQSPHQCEEDVEMILDILSHNSEIIPKCDDKLDSSGGSYWIVGNFVIYLKPLPEIGPSWYHVIIRRPSGYIEFRAELNIDVDSVSTLDISSPPLVKQNRSMSVGSRPADVNIQTLSLDRNKKDTKNISDSIHSDQQLLSQISKLVPFVDWSPRGPTAPLKVANVDEFFIRAIKVLDHIPVVDLHKIGIIYVAPGQTSEAEILSNTTGSPAYEKFLSLLGDFVDLKGCKDVYTGGLDTSSECIDGEKALWWADNDTNQIIFHTTTLMPNRENDDKRTFKKRHIGNDYVVIVWNESGIDLDGPNGGYKFDTVSAQFNFINLVLTPVSSTSDYIKLYVQRRPDIPETIGGGVCSGVSGKAIDDRPKLLGMNQVASFLRIFCIQASIFANVYNASLDSVGYAWNAKERLRQISRIRKRLEN